eukprot:2754021-Prymnesium_polylepis.1
MSQDLVLPISAYAALVSRLNASCASGAALVGLCGVPANESILDGYCYSMSADELAAWPPLQIALGGNVTLTLPPSAYVRHTCGDDDTYTVSIDAGADGDGTILGDVVMKPYNVVFDRAAKRVGFAPSTCGDAVEA